MKKHIPNTLTCANLFCGCIALVCVFYYRLEYAPYFIALAAVFDFFDGFAARLLNVKSDIGLQLDSLADMVTFGVVPGAIIFHLIRISLDQYNFPEEYAYLAFIISIFSALRLAKFNVDTRQTESFIGLPTPANAILIASFPLILRQLPADHPILHYTLLNPYFLFGFVILMSYLLISEIPMFSLKFKNLGWKDNKIRFIFVGLTAVLLVLFKYIAIPFVIIGYVGLSMINPTPSIDIIGKAKQKR